jgi:hypothetical protein
MIIAGLLTMRVLIIFQSDLEEGRPKPDPKRQSRITFNERWAQEMLKQSYEKGESVKSPVEPWEVTSKELVGIDNVLALARVRIDIERELRHIAFASGFESAYYSNTSDRLDKLLYQLLHEKQEWKVLPSSLVAVISEILKITNQAIHGINVSTETTESVVEVSRDVIRQLRIIAASIERTGSPQ